MREVSLRRLAAVLSLVILCAQPMAAKPRASGPSLGQRIRHLIIVILDELGGPNA